MKQAQTKQGKADFYSANDEFTIPDMLVCIDMRPLHFLRRFLLRQRKTGCLTATAAPGGFYDMLTLTFMQSIVQTLVEGHFVCLSPSKENISYHVKVA